MKRLLVIVSLLLAGCAGMQPKQHWDYGPDPVAVSSYRSPAIDLMVMTKGALPTLALKEMVLGQTIDNLLKGNYGSTNTVLCTSGSSTSFQAPMNCSIIDGTVMVETSNSLVLQNDWGFTYKNPASGNNGVNLWRGGANGGYPDGTGANYIGYQFDGNSGLISRFGKQIQLYAYHGLDIDVGEAGTVPANPTASEGVNITLHNTSSNVVIASGTGTGGITLTPGSGGVTIATNLVVKSSQVPPVVISGVSGNSLLYGLAFQTTTLTSGAATKTFSPAFTTNAPMCVCQDTTATAAVKCSATTTTLTLAGTGSDVIAWICIGQK